MLAKELMEMIFKADGDVEYSVPDDPITAELLEDGSFLKRATEICNMIMGDADYEAWTKVVDGSTGKRNGSQSGGAGWRLKNIPANTMR